MHLTHAPAVPALDPRVLFPPARSSAPARTVSKVFANALALAQSATRLLTLSEARACEQLHAIGRKWALIGPAPVAALRDRLREHCLRFEADALYATEAARRATEAWCERAYALGTIRLSHLPPRYPLLERVAPLPLEAGDPAQLQLRVALVRHFRVTLRQADPHLGELQRAVLRLLRKRKAVLCVAGEVRRDLERHLGAGVAARAFEGARDEFPGQGPARGLPDLLTDLQEILDIRITVGADTLAIV